MTQRLFMLQPFTKVTSRINMASATYPLNTLNVDTTVVHTNTAGGFSDDRPFFDSLLLLGSSAGADDRGRTRLRTGWSGGFDNFVFNLGRNSRGTRDGELYVSDNLYVTILDDLRPWSKPVFIDKADNDTIYKDGIYPYSIHTDGPRPVGNGGPGIAGTIDPITGYLTVTFDASNSFKFDSLGAAEPVDAYSWEANNNLLHGDESGGAWTPYSVKTGPTITWDFPPGFYWVTLSVFATGFTGPEIGAYIPVFARDPENDLSTTNFQIINHRIGLNGQQMTVKIFDDMAKSTFVDGGLVMIWDDEPSSPTDRTHMQFIGWHHADGFNAQATDTGTMKDTTLTLYDLATKMTTIPAFPQRIVAVDTWGEADTWSQMVNPSILQYLQYLLYWHSTVLQLGDWMQYGGATLETFAFNTLGSDQSDFYSQAATLCNAVTPDHLLNCTRRGQLIMVRDPNLLDSRSATVQLTLDDTMWTSIQFNYQRHPEVHWLRSGAILADHDVIVPIFCIAPGEAPGQGVTDINNRSDQRIAISQSALNSCEGHRYAQMNARIKSATITVPWELIKDTIEPALMQWVNLDLTGYASRRGIPYELQGTITRGLVQDITVAYQYAEEGTVATATLTWIPETSGTPAVTVEADLGD